jgi:predicted TIM-barrel fold metal-dependent hydrolase
VYHDLVSRIQDSSSLADEGDIPMIDSHMHIFDIRAVSAGGGSTRYTPDRSALFDEYLKLTSPLGFDGCLIVQPSFFRTDNSFLLRHLDVKNPSFKRFGVAVLPPRTSPETLETLHSKGVTGIRFNLVQADDDTLNFHEHFPASFWRTLDAIGMHVEIHVESNRLMKIVESLFPHVSRIVVDHFMRPSEGSRGFIRGVPSVYRDIEPFCGSGRIWVKTSAAYRVVPDKPHREAVRNCCDLAEMLAAMLGKKRILWGSDWPYTQNTYKVEGDSPADQFQSVATTRELWTKGGVLYDPELAFRELTGV